MSRTMAIMPRATSFSSFSSDSHSAVWQYEHVTPRELDMKDMTGMSCEVGIPFNTLMFFFVSSTGLSLPAFCANVEPAKSAASNMHQRDLFMRLCLLSS